MQHERSRVIPDSVNHIVTTLGVCLLAGPATSHYKTTMCTTLVSPGTLNDMSSSASTAEIIAFYDAAYVSSHISFVVATESV